MLHPRAIIMCAYIFACILLRQEGMPCVFHGDLYGIPHDSISPVTFLPRLLPARKHCAHGQQSSCLNAPDIIFSARRTGQPGTILRVSAGKPLGAIL